MRAILIGHFFEAPEPELAAGLWRLAASRTTGVAHNALLALGSLGREQPGAHGQQTFAALVARLRRVPMNHTAEGPHAEELHTLLRALGNHGHDDLLGIVAPPPRGTRGPGSVSGVWVDRLAMVQLYKYLSRGTIVPEGAYSRYPEVYLGTYYI
jgi:hypothetical protein